MAGQQGEQKSSNEALRAKAGHIVCAGHMFLFEEILVYEENAQTQRAQRSEGERDQVVADVGAPTITSKEVNTHASAHYNSSRQDATWRS